jgi:hypothetical protein
MVVWYDSDGRRQRRSRSTLKEAEELAAEVSGALKDMVNGAITLHDRQSYNLAGELVEPFGCTRLLPSGPLLEPIGQHGAIAHRDQARAIPSPFRSSPGFPWLSHPPLS